MNNLNKYDVSTYDLKKEICEQRKVINKLTDDNNRLRESINIKDNSIRDIVNSKGWRTLESFRKIARRIKHNNKVYDKKNDNKVDEYKHDYHELMPYDSNYQENEDFSDFKTDIKAVAFYLPQFHQFKENDEWWGEGFTEWTNTKKSKPHFEGHYQPREPHDDIGYYKLDNIETIKSQVSLAKKHGVYGFCFYYYWFSGKRLMEKPVDMLLEHPEIDFPFCLCWANENWTRTWDGSENKILIKQDYSDEDNYKFIYDLKKYIDDKRYIRLDGKPIIMIYNPTQIPDLQKLISEWRKCARDIGIGELYIMTKDDLACDDFKNMEFADAEFDFVPNGMGHPSCVVTGLDTPKAFDYTQMVDDIEHLYVEHFPLKPFYYSCTMGWDNSARRKENYRIYYRYSLTAFYKWLRIIIKQTRLRNPSDRRFVFINAWNEWAEGTYLEPDKKYGYANINTLSRAIYDLPLNVECEVIKKKKLNIKKNNSKIAIHVHAFYLDLLDEIIYNLNKMPYSYDLYVSTDSESKVRKIRDVLKNGLVNVNKLQVKKYINRGRDVLPFLSQMKPVFNDYDYVCHIHTKKSVTGTYGDSWRKYLYYNLFGTTQNLNSIFDIFNSRPDVGVIYPLYYTEIVDMIGIGGNKDNLIKLFEAMNLKIDKDFNNLSFPAGTMFWARSDALLPLFLLDIDSLKFDDENGQVDGTMPHAIERSICLVSNSQGYKSIQILNKTEGDNV